MRGLYALVLLIALLVTSPLAADTAVDPVRRAEDAAARAERAADRAEAAATRVEAAASRLERLLEALEARTRQNVRR